MEKRKREEETPKTSKKSRFDDVWSIHFPQIWNLVLEKASTDFSDSYAGALFVCKKWYKFLTEHPLFPTRKMIYRQYQKYDRDLELLVIWHYLEQKAIERIEWTVEGRIYVLRCEADHQLSIADVSGKAPPKNQNFGFFAVESPKELLQQVYRYCATGRTYGLTKNITIDLFSNLFNSTMNLRLQISDCKDAVLAQKVAEIIHPYVQILGKNIT